MKRKLSLISLIIANLYPIFGALFFDWDLSKMLILYWIETIIIEIFTIFKIQHSKFVRLDRGSQLETNLLYTMIEGEKSKALAKPLLKKICIVGFVFVFGMFALVHLTILHTALSTGGFFFSVFNIINQSTMVPSYINAPQVNISIYILPVIILTISHAISYYVNFIGKQESEKIAINDQLVAPFERVYIMQLTTGIAAFILFFVNLPIIPQLILLLVKAGFDVVFHERQHKKMSFLFPESYPTTNDMSPSNQPNI